MIWPRTTVIELNPDANAVLSGDVRGQAWVLRAAVAALARVDGSVLELPDIGQLPSGVGVVTLAGDGPLMRSLQTIARRRGTNSVEALHAAIHAYLDS